MNQITTLQAIFIGLWAAVAIIGTLLGNYTAVPIIYAAGVGVILQDIPTGVIVGAAGQIVWLGFGIGQGGVRPPDPIAPGIFAPVVAIVSRRQSDTTTLITISDAGLYIGLSIAVGILMQIIVTALFTAMSPFSTLAQNALRKNRFGMFRFYSNITLILFTVLGFVIGLLVGLSATGISTAAGQIPDWLRTGLRVAGGMLPALGFALILKVMLKREYLGFAFLGYALAVIFDVVAKQLGQGFSVLALSMAALAIILIVVSIGKLANISKLKAQAVATTNQIKEVDNGI